MPLIILAYPFEDLCSNMDYICCPFGAPESIYDYCYYVPIRAQKDGRYYYLEQVNRDEYEWRAYVRFNNCDVGGD